jgi:hypothetical protein
MSNLKKTAFSDVTHSMEDVYEHVGGIYHLHLHSRRHANLMMVLASASEPLVNNDQTTRYHIPENHVFQSHCHENP